MATFEITQHARVGNAADAKLLGEALDVTPGATFRETPELDDDGEPTSRFMVALCMTVPATGARDAEGAVETLLQRAADSVGVRVSMEESVALHVASE
jgi:hypothetical protein